MKNDDIEQEWTASYNLEDIIDPDAAVPPIRTFKPSDLAIVFQPIIDLRTGQLFAHEALTRCQIPQYINPVTLFNTASEQQACGYLGRTVREVIFAQKPKGRLFINLHPDELNARWIVRPDDPICLHGEDLFLEITESAKFKFDDLSFDVLNDVCSRTGAQVVLDDLGTGYSNLNRLANYSPSIVKLDYSLTQNMDKNKRKRIMVTELVKLCEALDAKVVIENIETLGEFVAAQDSGAHYGQGFYIGRPQSMANMDGLTELSLQKK